MLECQNQWENPYKIVNAKCDYHMSNTSATQASVTSGHNHNLDPGCDESLSNIHSIIVCIKRYGTRMNVYENIQNEHGRKKFQTLDFAVQTR